MNQTIDGMPVAKVTTTFSGDVIDTTGAIAAGQVVPLLVLVQPDKIHHAERGDDVFHRRNEVVVMRMAAVPAELRDLAMAALRGEIGAGDEGQWHEFVPDETSRAAQAPPLIEQVRAALDESPDGASAAPANVAPDVQPEPTSQPVADTEDEGADDDDDFLLPPPLPAPEGVTTLRRIVPGDERLRDFLGA